MVNFTKRSRLRISSLILLLVTILCLISTFTFTMNAEAKSSSAEAYGSDIYIIPIDGDITKAKVSFIERAIEEAEAAQAEHIIYYMNTFGGETDSALSIAELMKNTSIPSSAYIETKAVSAGTYLALHADQIFMQKGSTIGSAAVVNASGNLIDNPKTISFWVEQMKEAAKLNNRSTDIAVAMVDPRVEVDLTNSLGYVKKANEVIAISADDALRVGYAEGVVNNLDEVISTLGYEDRMIATVDMSFAEKAAVFLTNPIVTTILLILGIAGIIIELLFPGFGVPGIIGLISLSLFFFGSYIAGIAGMETAMLFIIGIILVIIEVIVPAFGLLGLLGGGAIIAGVLLASVTWQSGVFSLLVAFIVSIILVVIFSKTQKGKGIWHKFVLKEKLTTEEGFLPTETKSSLVGLKGTTLTALRPAGAALINDQRIDVVTEGGFVEANKPVVVVKAEGTWVVVREIK